MAPMKTLDVPLASSNGEAPTLSRRHVLQGVAALAASTLISGCGSSSASTTTPPPAGSQPTPAGPMTAATLSVSATAAGSIGPAFAGLSYEKSSINESPYLFTASNANLISLFKRVGPSVLRIGGNS